MTRFDSLATTPVVMQRIAEGLESGCFELAKTNSEEQDVCICPRCGHIGLFTTEPGNWYEHSIWWDKTERLWKCTTFADLC